MEETLEAIWQEYLDLCHAMQSGVAAEMNYDQDPVTPKHLRTGVNSALVDSAALAGLLIEKGLITRREFYTALRDKMKAEVATYEKRLSERHGASIKLA